MIFVGTCGKVLVEFELDTATIGWLSVNTGHVLGVLVKCIIQFQHVYKSGQILIKISIYNINTIV